MAAFTKHSPRVDVCGLSHHAAAAVVANTNALSGLCKAQWSTNDVRGRSAGPHWTWTLRRPAQTSTIPYHTIPYHTIPYHTIPYHTIPYHTILSTVGTPACTCTWRCVYSHAVLSTPAWVTMRAWRVGLRVASQRAASIHDHGTTRSCVQTSCTPAGMHAPVGQARTHAWSRTPAHACKTNVQRHVGRGRGCRCRQCSHACKPHRRQHGARQRVLPAATRPRGACWAVSSRRCAFLRRE